MRRSAPLTETGQLVTDLTRKEKKMLQKLIPQRAKRIGFRVFTKSPGFLTVLEEKLEAEQTRQKAACEAEGVDYVPMDQFALREKIKLREWQTLTEDEKQHWRQIAEAMPTEDDEMSE